MDLVSRFSFLPPEIATMILAMIPLTELQGSIPVALTVYQLDPLAAYFFSIIGNLIPAVIILWLLGPISGWLIKHSSWAESFFSWLFAHTRHRFTGKYERWGALGLILFVALPGPLTGVWTGSVAAFLFGIQKVKALLLIALGIMITGLIILLATLGVISFF